MNTELNFEGLEEGHWLLSISTEDLKIIAKLYNCAIGDRNRAQLQKRILKLIKEGILTFTDPEKAISACRQQFAELKLKNKKEVKPRPEISSPIKGSLRPLGDNFDLTYSANSSLKNEPVYENISLDIDKQIEQNLINLSPKVSALETNTDPLAPTSEEDSESEAETVVDPEEYLDKIVDRFDKFKMGSEAAEKIKTLEEKLETQEKLIQLHEKFERSEELGRSRPFEALISLVTFHGKEKEDIYEFLETYNAEADTYGWSDGDRIEKLKRSLRGDALSSWLSCPKYKTNTGWEDVQNELANLFRKDEGDLEETLETMTFKDGQNYHQYIGKFYRLMKQLKPKITDEDITDEIMQTLPEKVRVYMTNEDVRNKSSLIEAFGKWQNYKKRAFEKSKLRQMTERVAALELENKRRSASVVNVNENKRKSAVDKDNDLESDKCLGVCKSPSNCCSIVAAPGVSCSHQFTHKSRGGVPAPLTETCRPAQGGFHCPGRMGNPNGSRGYMANNHGGRGRGQAGWGRNNSCGQTGPFAKQGRPTTNATCFNCKKPGHLAKDCWSQRHWPYDSRGTQGPKGNWVHKGHKGNVGNTKAEGNCAQNCVHSKPESKNGKTSS